MGDAKAEAPAADAVVERPRAGTAPALDPRGPLGVDGVVALHGVALYYSPTEPPAAGSAAVTLRVFIDFKDFDRWMMRRKEFAGHRWTAAQVKEFKWPPDERTKWAGKFTKAVADGWSEKHTFAVTDPAWEPYRAKCVVTATQVARREEADTTITAQWVPTGAPRLRSSVSGSTAELDARDSGGGCGDEARRPQ